jgi:putative hydrolase of HD superfamily
MEQIARFLFEVGQLKRVARSGWWVAGVRDPESVAEHSFRCIWIGYLLAREAGADPARVALMCLAHDLPEARTNDLHKISQAYLNAQGAERGAFSDQVQNLSGSAQLRQLYAEYEAGETLEASLARDADRLECAFQALEYVDEGHRPCRAWYENTGPKLKTDAGRALFAALARTDPGDWYQGIPRLP